MVSGNFCDVACIPKCCTGGRSESYFLPQLTGKKNNKKSLNKTSAKKHSLWHKETGTGRFKATGERTVVALNRNIHCRAFPQ